MMPVLKIQIVGETLPNANVIREIADRAGEILHSAPGQTWVLMDRIAPKQYAENRVAAEDLPHPVFVSVLKYQAPSDAVQLQSEITALTSTIAALLDHHPENVHIIYEPDARGRLAFGGKLVT